MRVQKVTVLTHEDIEQERPGKVVVVGMAEYMAFAKRFGCPAQDIFRRNDGLDMEGWAFVTWTRLRRAEPDTTPESFEEWCDGIASAWPELLAREFEKMDETMAAGDPEEEPEPEGDPTSPASSEAETPSGGDSDPTTSPTSPSPESPSVPALIPVP